MSRYQGTLNLNPDEYHLYAVEGNEGRLTPHHTMKQWCVCVQVAVVCVSVQAAVVCV